MLILILMFIFSNFCHSCFLGKFGPIIWISSNWLKFRRGVHCYMLITVLMFIFSKFFSFIFFGQIWSQNLKFFKLTKIWYRCRLILCLFWFWCLFFQKFCHSYNFGQIWKISKYYGQISFHLVFSILTELHHVSMLNFSKYGEQQILGWNFPQKFMNGKYFEKLHIKTVISI